jgi:hypothetical protein
MFAYLPEIFFRFRAREPRGHILEGKDFQVIDTMRDIFLRNGRALFQGDPQRLAAFEAHVAAMHARLERRLTLRALVRRPRLLPEALRRLWRAGPAVAREPRRGP